MKDSLIELVFVMDRSGSMRAMASEAIGGFNSFLQDQVDDKDNEARMTLVLFDHEYQVVYEGEDVKKVQPLCEDTYQTRGTTALLDAVGRTIDDVGRRLDATPEEERPSKVLVAVLTDGLENASRDYSKSKIMEMVQHQTDKYSWEFMFLAANQDAFTAGTGMGVKGNLTMTYDSCSLGGFRKAFGAMRKATTTYKCSASLDAVDLQQMHDDEDGDDDKDNS